MPSLQSWHSLMTQGSPSQQQTSSMRQSRRVRPLDEVGEAAGSWDSKPGHHTRGGGSHRLLYTGDSRSQRERAGLAFRAGWHDPTICSCQTHSLCEVLGLPVTHCLPECVTPPHSQLKCRGRKRWSEHVPTQPHSQPGSPIQSGACPLSRGGEVST